MKETNREETLVWTFLPFIGRDEIDHTNQTIRSFRSQYPISDDDYKRVTELHNLIFRRLIQIDPKLRRKRPSELGRPSQQLLTTRERHCSKSEAKAHLTTVHHVLDKYAVPAPERTRFFKALMIAWYYVRIAAMADLESESIKFFQ